MGKSKPTSQTQKAREDVNDGKYDPPHSGLLRDTVLGSSYSEKERQDRKEYKYAYRRAKERK